MLEAASKLLSIACGIDSCSEVYKKYDSYRAHIYKKHRDCLVDSSSLRPELPDGETHGNDVDETQQEEGSELPQVDDSSVQALSQSGMAVIQFFHNGQLLCLS